MADSSSDNERRHFHRINFQGVAFFDCDSHETPVTLLDLSLHGALVTLDGDVGGPMLDHHCVLRVPLAPELDIRMETRVVRVQGRELGLAVQRLDLESAQHLKRLVELNLGDDTLLNRDLAAFFETSP